MRAIASLSFLLASALTLPAALADEPSGDLARLQGTWTAQVGNPPLLKLNVTIKGKAVEMVVVTPLGPEVKTTGEMIVDEKASPKTFDWVKFTSTQGKEVAPILGIYKLDGDTWTTCMAGAGKARPTEFKDLKDTPPQLTIFTRVPKEKAVADDLSRMQGTWLASVGPAEDVALTLVVKDKTYSASWERGDGTKVELKGEVRLDEKAKVKKVDFIKTQRNDGDDDRDNLGIYAFEGDRLNICVGGAGNERPTEFKNGDDGARLLLKFTRKKD